MPQPPLVLASASPRRAALLRELGLEFVVVASTVQEAEPRHLSPAEICQLNALNKARDVACRHDRDWVLGADTLVVLGDRVFGKPGDRREAVNMLRQLQGREHHVITGVCFIHLASGRADLFAEATGVLFRPLTDAEIQDYIDRVDPLDKAGAYGIQEHGERIIEGIRGSFSNVMGLPLERLRRHWDTVPGWSEFCRGLP